jgi:uncharacterized Zn-finger protein
VLSAENCTIKTSVSLNDELVQVPNVSSRIETITDLATLVYSLQEVKLCLNSNLGFSKCSKYVFNNESNLCDVCSFEVFSDIRKTEIDVMQPPVFLENISFDTPVLLEPSPEELDLRQEKERNYLCTVCGKTFNCSSGLDHHMLTHAPPTDKPFKCKVCMKAFAKKYNLNVHIRVHSGERPYVCSKCGKTYSTRSNLSTHMNSAHRDEKRHHCDLCEMTFVHPRVLKIHMRKHTGEKPFMCQVCGKVFSKKIHLTIHTRTHTGEKPYVCTECGKGFTTTGNLNSHKKINHKA